MGSEFAEPDAPLGRLWVEFHSAKPDGDTWPLRFSQRCTGNDVIGRLIREVLLPN